jgi:hypothetical protein
MALILSTPLEKIYFDYFMKMHKKELGSLPLEICYKIFKMTRAYIGHIHTFYKDVISVGCEWIFGKPPNSDYDKKWRFVINELQNIYILPERPAIMFKCSNFIEYDNLNKQTDKIIESMINLYDIYHPLYKQIKTRMCKENYVYIFVLEEKHKEKLDTISDEELITYYSYLYFKYQMGTCEQYFIERINENKIYCIPLSNGPSILSLLAAKSYNGRRDIIHNKYIDDGKLYYVLSYYDYGNNSYDWLNEIKELPSNIDLGINEMTETEIEEYYAQFDYDGDVWFHYDDDYLSDD